MFGNRILILVPHPDDEIVACAAAIGRARDQGSEIFTLYLTHGCIARETLWPWARRKYEQIVARRRDEAEQAAKFLGVTPVGWSDRPARFLWQHLAEAYNEIKAAIVRFKIDQLWVPAYEGGNADHDALNALTCLFTTKISVLEFAEYNFVGGKTCSQEFPHPNGSEYVVELTGEERKKKRAALDIYDSETSNLNYVEIERECCRPLMAYDYSRPPHPGTLWYIRFQWVPFKHPRVDFTNPADVSSAITAFLKSQAA